MLLLLLLRIFFISSTIDTSDFVIEHDTALHSFGNRGLLRFHDLADRCALTLSLDKRSNIKLFGSLLASLLES